MTNATRWVRGGWVCLSIGLVYACGGGGTSAGPGAGSGGTAETNTDGSQNDGPGDKAGPNGGSNPGPGNAGPGPAGGDSTDTVDPNVDWEALDVVYSPMYSAYDGQHVFSLPAFITGVSTEVEQWRAIPADAVSFSPWQSDDKSQVGVLITVERPEPEVEILVQTAGIGGKATLHITEATPEEWELGKERYINGDAYDPEALANDPDLIARIPLLLTMIMVDADGNTFFTGTAADLGISSDMRCDTCHTTGAENFQVQHTPTQAARFSDDELKTIFTQGMKPEGVGYRVLPEMYQNYYSLMHKWNASDEQIRGLIVYLRSLTPEGQGDIMLPFGLTSAEVDYDKLPASCNPMGAAYNAILCFAELPPVCQVGNPGYDMTACLQMITEDAPEEDG